ncbi:Copine-7 [Symbiodinium microadriaticum]|uniref:Copine-7 n=1 Tax=Symbiodinium microadriaticum TaxID=2951 RepID=A0A1Q9F7M2_SYMMI|nr:Copine-7 [Symbiodinium microadriaticum]
MQDIRSTFLMGVDDGSEAGVYKAKMTTLSTAKLEALSVAEGLRIGGPIVTVTADMRMDIGFESEGNVQTSPTGKSTLRQSTMRQTTKGFAEKETLYFGKEDQHIGVDNSHAQLNDMILDRAYTFLDYVRGGLELRMMLGIDFTRSNAAALKAGPEPNASASYKRKGSGLFVVLVFFLFLSSFLRGLVDMDLPTSYETAIIALGSVLRSYDTTDEYAVYGFGARYMGSMGFFELAYRRALQVVHMHGPTCPADEPEKEGGVLRSNVPPDMNYFAGSPAVLVGCMYVFVYTCAAHWQDGDIVNEKRVVQELKCEDADAIQHLLDFFLAMAVVGSPDPSAVEFMVAKSSLLRLEKLPESMPDVLPDALEGKMPLAAYEEFRVSLDGEFHSAFEALEAVGEHQCKIWMVVVGLAFLALLLSVILTTAVGLVVGLVGFIVPILAAGVILFGWIELATRRRKSIMNQTQSNIKEVMTAANAANPALQWTISIPYRVDQDFCFKEYPISVFFIGIGTSKDDQDEDQDHDDDADDGGVAGGNDSDAESEDDDVHEKDDDGDNHKGDCISDGVTSYDGYTSAPKLLRIAMVFEDFEKTKKDTVMCAPQSVKVP